MNNRRRLSTNNNQIRANYRPSNFNKNNSSFNPNAYVLRKERMKTEYHSASNNPSNARNLVKAGVFRPSSARIDSKSTMLKRNNTTNNNLINIRGKSATGQRRPKSSNVFKRVQMTTTQSPKASNRMDMTSNVTLIPHPDYPGEIVAKRNDIDNDNRERLNLDRRNLQKCVHLENEIQLRLLNYEHNQITKIEHLHNGLDNIPNLRVLMLGKNKIKKIERLESLKSLDVLDLHSNQIDKIENLEHLKVLRILNLAGNQLSVIENLNELSSLIELNLRRNQIQHFGNDYDAPCLQRIFLSNNRFNSMESIVPLNKFESLLEISLEGNLVSRFPLYRLHLIQQNPRLTRIDQAQVSPNERSRAQNWNTHNRDTNNNELHSSPKSEQRNIESKHVSQDSGSIKVINTFNNSSSKEHQVMSNEVPGKSNLSTNNSTISNHSEPLNQILTPKRVNHLIRPLFTTGLSKMDVPTLSVDDDIEEKEETNQMLDIKNTGDIVLPTRKKDILQQQVPINHSDTSNNSVKDNQTTNRIIDIENEKKNIYVSTERTLYINDSPNNLNTVHKNTSCERIIIDNVDIDIISSYISKLKRLSSLKSLVLKSSNICNLVQLDWISALNLMDLTILQNPICDLPLLIHYIASIMPSLQSFNGQFISLADRGIAKKRFSKLVALRNELDSNIDSSQSQLIAKVSNELDEFVSILMHDSCKASKCLQEASIVFPSVVNKLIDDTLNELDDVEVLYQSIAAKLLIE